MAERRNDPCGCGETAGASPHPRIAPDRIGDDGTWPMPAGSGPCRTWPLEPGCGCLAPGDRNSGSWGGAATWTDEQTHAVEVATEILWRLTAGKYGLCWETIRPCRQTAIDPKSAAHRRAMQGVASTSPMPAVVDGVWVNIACGCRGGRCSCGPVSEVALPGPVYWEPPVGPPDPHAPVGQSLSQQQLEPGSGDGRYHLVVWLDGQQLDGNDYGEYWLLDGNRLIRTDGGAWPDCQDLTRPLTDEGTFGVQYWRGYPVPPGGRRAVAILACELWKACTGDSSCRLPQHVQSVTREGVQYQMVDPTDYTTGGRTGLPDVDMWLSTVNPKGVREQPGVWSPDMPRSYTEWIGGSEHPDIARRRGRGW